MSEFTFTENGHIYTTKDGIVIPSVTQILQAKYFCDDWYKERGTYIHQMAELYKLGKLDEDTLDEQLRPYLAALKKYECEAPHIKGVGDYKSGVFQKWHLLQTAAYRELWLNGIDENNEPLRKLSRGFEVRGYHPVYRYAGTIDIIDVEDGNNYPSAFLIYLKDTGKYKLESISTIDIRQHTQAFLALAAAEQVREQYKISI